MTHAFKQYLLAERDVDSRSEYIEVKIYVMTEASELHNTIATTFCSAIDNSLPDECRVWQ